MAKIWSVSESTIALVTYPHSTKTPKHISYCGIITRPYPLSTFKIILLLFSFFRIANDQVIDLSDPSDSYCMSYIHKWKHNHRTQILENIEISVQTIHTTYIYDFKYLSERGVKSLCRSLRTSCRPFCSVSILFWVRS